MYDNGEFESAEGVHPNCNKLWDSNTSNIRQLPNGLDLICPKFRVSG